MGGRRGKTNHMPDKTANKANADRWSVSKLGGPPWIEGAEVVEDVMIPTQFGVASLAHPKGSERRKSLFQGSTILEEVA